MIYWFNNLLTVTPSSNIRIIRYLLLQNGGCNDLAFWHIDSIIYSPLLQPVAPAELYGICVLLHWRVLRNGAIPNTSTSLSISTAVIVPFILLSSLYWVSEKSTIKKTWKNINDVSDCCLMPNKQYFIYFIVKQVTFVEMSSLYYTNTLNCASSLR